METHEDSNENPNLEEPLLQSEDSQPQSVEVTPSSDPNQDEPHHKSRNVPLTLWYQALRCGGEAIWLGSVLAAYVYLLKPNNPEMIGYLSALEGIVQFVAACLAGVLGDLYRRDTLLKAASCIGVTASCLIVASCVNPKLFVCLAVALGMNGAFDGIGLTASLAIFTDSIAIGERSYYFTQRNLCTTGGQFVGPIFGLFFFYLLGDEWTVAACAKVIGGAQVLLLPAFFLLCLFRDQDAVNADASSDEDGTLEGNDNIPTPEDEEGQAESDRLITDNSSEPYLFGFSQPRVIAISAATMRGVPRPEWDLRVQLSAAKRLISYAGMDVNVWGHASCRVPVTEETDPSQMLPQTVSSHSILHPSLPCDVQRCCE